MLFKRNPEVPVMLGEGYQIDKCRFMPKFIDFGASIIGNNDEDAFSDDVGQLVLTFDRIHKQTELLESYEYEEAAGSLRTNYKVIRDLLDLPYFAEFHSGPKHVDAICMGCMTRATHKIIGTNFHVCGERCKMFCL